MCVGDDSSAGSGALDAAVFVMHRDVVVRRPREVSAAAFILLQVVMPDFTITRDETSTITMQSLHVSHLLGVLHVLLLSQFYTKALKKSVDVVSVSSGIRVASEIL